ncbi:hypothetical protein [Corynebacterium guangdongense]|uniref:DUF3180 domain-containing protein n=1 Tax=Corynebacterium guangdongense TaxID=1783348 RepID=A0ABU2A144_9CORY|nr:hypothetical protein [Corynebacterium guangdongense]MDR7330740.1 hypothetical protein [Corynebacterium guangdongense]
MATSDTDYYALDDTLAGRLAQAGLAGAMIAVPDVIPVGRGRRTLARLGVAAVGVTAAALANYVDEDPDNDDPARLVAEMGADSVARTWALLGAGGAAWALAARGASSAAGLLRAGGVEKPYLLLGTLASAGVFAVSQRQHHDTDRRSTHV